jgi:hypothetical protein
VCFGLAAKTESESTGYAAAIFGVNPLSSIQHICCVALHLQQYLHHSNLGPVVRNALVVYEVKVSVL